MRSVRTAAFAGLSLLAAVPAFANELSNGRITVDFDVSGSQTADRVDSISWINSSGTSTGNLAVAGGPVNCGDPQEFFGASYSDSDGGPLGMIVNGASAKWTSKNDTSGTSKTTGKDACFTLSGRTTTAYSLSSSSRAESMMKIERTFAFKNALSGNLRAYAARLSLNIYNEVIYPDSTGTLQTIALNSCPFATASGCEISNWNGTWFADDDGSGHGMVMIRDKSSTAPAEIAVDYDSDSASNVTSILLMQPEEGWSGKLTETEYMCFYDATSWTAKDRAKGKLPKGCQVR
jgi:hypothetical protein